jgi:hypothetical protein
MPWPKEQLRTSRDRAVTPSCRRKGGPEGRQHDRRRGPYRLQPALLRESSTPCISKGVGRSRSLFWGAPRGLEIRPLSISNNDGRVHHVHDYTVLAIRFRHLPASETIPCCPRIRSATVAICLAGPFRHARHAIDVSRAAHDCPPDRPMPTSGVARLLP